MDKKPVYRGLSDAEVAESRARHGANVLTPVTKETWWQKFAAKFRDPLIIILLIAGTLSVGISCYEYWGLESSAEVFFEPVGIFVAIILATGLAFVFEQKADKEFEILNKVNDDEPVNVVRNGFATRIARKDVVVGDTVFVSAGEEVPADGVMTESVFVSVDESTLTGEPLCHKTIVEKDFDADATFPSNHLYRGTKVMEGHGVMTVTAVGDSTEYGKVYEASKIDSNVVTPLNRQLERLGKLISTGAYLFAFAVVVARIGMYAANVPFEWLSFLTYFLQTVMIAVTLIVVAVPEGLPMAVTLSLAYSMRRMFRTNNLVRKMHACETMGATTVICTDKTGTLTQNMMQVSEFDFFGNPDENTVNESIALNSTALLDVSGEKTAVLGNPTEGALLLWLRDRGVDYAMLRSQTEFIKELPFSTERKYMATIVRRPDGQKVLYVKGAPEIIFAMCDECPGLTKAEFEEKLRNFQNSAMRTLGFAYRDVDVTEDDISDSAVSPKGLVFLGIAAISDPVRPDVPEAIRTVRDAGIQIKIVTGDTPGTAKEIGRRIGLWNDETDSERNIITGDNFSRLSDEELRMRVADLKIIARARPADKKRLVEALQAAGEIVAVTGDGTNDAPALKTAHVGLSMGDGTSVAKEASDITIIDNSFSSIGRAVMWGRSLYRNIQRFILFQLTVNVVACLTVFVGALMGMQSPLTVTQMLWVNLIMDTFAAVALASLPPSPSVMRDKPRSRSAFIITKAMWRFIVGVGLLLFGVLFLLLYMLEPSPIPSVPLGAHVATGSASGLSEYDLSLFFTFFVFLQFWNIFNAKAFASGRSALHFKGCGGFLLIITIIFVGQILIVTFGHDFFNVCPLRFTDWVAIILLTSAVLWIGELLRLCSKR